MKVFVLGLDGATPDVLEPLLEAGQMPNLAALKSSGAGGVLLSTVPPTSPVAWSTFVTGKNPGKHGIYDFLEYGHNPMRGSVNSSRAIQGETLWEIAARAGRKAAVAGVALTYPPRTGAGLQIGDFLSPSRAKDLSNDPGLLAEMEQAIGPYEPWCTAAYYRRNELEVIRRLRAFLEYHLAAIRFLLGRAEWDLFAYNLMAVDRLLHEVWHVWDESHPFRKGRDLWEARESWIDFFRAIDRAVGEISGKLPTDCIFLVISDHGNGAVTHYLNLNLWLLREGYIALRQGAVVSLKKRLFERGKNPSWAYRRLARLGFSEIVVKRLRGGQLGFMDRLADIIFLSKRDIDWTRTRVYAQGNYGQINVNLRGREPQGIVAPGREAEDLIEEIRSKLLSLRMAETEEPLIRSVDRGGSLYAGPRSGLAPDLIVNMRDPHHHTVGLFDFTSHKLLMRAFSMSGDHRPEGVLYARGPAIQPGSAPGRGSGLPARLQDLAPTILHFLGIPIPRDMDGRVLSEILAPSFREEPAYEGAAAEAVPSRSGPPPGPPSMSEDEEAEVRRRLRDLGYL